MGYFTGFMFGYVAGFCGAWIGLRTLQGWGTIDEKTVTYGNKTCDNIKFKRKKASPAKSPHAK